MNDDVREAASAAAEDEEIRAALERLLEQPPPWEFEELSIDSGRFGRLVDAGVLESTGDGYRLADPDAVQAALDNESGRQSNQSDGTVTSYDFDPTTLLTLLTLLGLVAAVRTLFSFPAVSRPVGTVLAGNDPYMYHHIVEQLLASDRTAFALGDLGRLDVSFLQFEVRTHDTLTIVMLWWAAALVGESHEAVAAVVAWAPVVAGVVTAGCVYWLAGTVTGDNRVAVVATLLLAVTPAHAYRTSLGFGDHHAFDYLWLAVTLLAVVRLLSSRTRTETRPRSLAWVIVGGAAVAAQTTAWRGGPLLLIPLGGVAVVQSGVALYREQSPLLSTGPLVAVLGTGALGVLVVHLGLGWLRSSRAFAPVLLAVGTATVVGVTTVGSRTGLDPRVVVAGEIVAGVAAAVLSLLVVPSVGGAFGRVVAYFGTYGGSGIAETQSLFGPGVGTVVGPVLLFGFLLFLALPYVVWACHRGLRGDAAWLVLGCYSAWLFALATIQSRFAGELSVLVAVLAGIGFVHLGSWVDLTEPPVPFAENPIDWSPAVSVELQTVARWLVLLLLVAGPGLLQTSVKIDQVTIDDADYEAGVWLGTYADEHELSYPNNYVLSQWGRNRADNYLVNGETESYDYAQRQYGSFVTATDATGWYGRLAERDVGFVLVETRSSGQGTVGERLWTAFGGRTPDNPGLGHYRVVYADETDGPLVAAVVSGATVTGAAPPNTTVTLSTEVTVPPDGRTISYERRVEAGADGWYAVTVPYAGEYSVDGEIVTVPETTVEIGKRVSVQSDNRSRTSTVSLATRSHSLSSAMAVHTAVDVPRTADTPVARSVPTTPASSVRSSLAPHRRVVTTGVPQASDSKTTFPKASNRAG